MTDGWHHWLDGHECEKTPGAVDGQGSLACCSAWGHRVRNSWVTELNWTKDRNVIYQHSPLLMTSYSKSPHIRSMNSAYTCWWGRQGSIWNSRFLSICHGFPGGSVVKNPPANAGDMDSIPGLGKSAGGGNGNPLQYSCLGNPTDRKAWQATVHGVAKSRTRLSN